MHKWKTAAAVCLILFGIGLYLYPVINEQIMRIRTEQSVESFQEAWDAWDHNEKETEEETKAGEEEETAAQSLSPEEASYLANLWVEIQSYNAEIYRDKQEQLIDAESYEQPPVSVEGLEEMGFGFIEIPAMEQTLPLYIGASTEHMKQGAAVLGQTSIPVGGVNTNSVIAGHRGYRGTLFFRHIEVLALGDYVYITNPWGKLAYRVTAIDIIHPSDVEAIKIQEGKDMITLLTCHPYASHGKYRYLVFCERDPEEEARVKEGDQTPYDPQKEAENDQRYTDDQGREFLINSDGEEFQLSEEEIQREDLFRKICAGIIVAMAGATCVVRVRRKRKHRE